MVPADCDPRSPVTIGEGPANLIESKEKRRAG